MYCVGVAVAQEVEHSSSVWAPAVCVLSLWQDTEPHIVSVGIAGTMWVFVWTVTEPDEQVASSL